MNIIKVLINNKGIMKVLIGNLGLLLGITGSADGVERRSDFEVKSDVGISSWFCDETVYAQALLPSVLLLLLLLAPLDG